MSIPTKPTKPKFSRQDLMAFFQDIIQGGPVVNGETLPSMEQRMKAAVTLMALLDKQPEEEDGVLTFKVTPQQIQTMQNALYHCWKQSLERALYDQKNRMMGDDGHKTPSLPRQNPVEGRHDS
ncbi:MAG: hypothetical protein ACKO57_07160 [Alphaproteobacteria bacterium]